jgi:hypothetical protein
MVLWRIQGICPLSFVDYGGAALNTVSQVIVVVWKMHATEGVRA